MDPTSRAANEPRYSDELPPSYSETHSETHLDQENGSTIRRERLPKFITYRPAVEYDMFSDLNKQDMPAKQDRALLWTLTMKWAALIYNRVALTVEETIYLENRIFEHIIVPADHLSLPRGTTS